MNTDKKTKVVFDGVEDVQQYELEHYLARLRADFMCPKWARKCAVSSEGFVPAKVTYTQALNFVRDALVVGLTTCPLREVVDRAATIGSVKLSIGGATVHTKGDKIELTAVAGYFVPPNRVKDVLDNWVADAVSFQHTPLSKKEVGVVDNAVTTAIEKSLRLSEQSFNVGVPGNWTSDAIDNADGLLAMFQKPKLAFNSAKYAANMSEHWKVHGERVVVKAPSQIQDKITHNVKGESVIAIPCAVLQPNLVPVDELGFYKDLTKHREVRGADGNGRSRLTSGSYLGSMSRALDQQLWQSIDILHMCTVLKRHSVYFLARPNFNVVNTLMANEIDVHVQSHKHLGKTKFKVFRTAPSAFNNGLAYIDGFFGITAPLVNKKSSVIGQLESEFDDLFNAFVKLDGYAITHVYLRDYHCKYLTYIFPSVHVHAGHVMICNRELHKGDTFTIKNLYARAAMANKYKTSFAVRRVPFITQDRLRPEFLSTTGIVLGLPVDDNNMEEYGETVEEKLDMSLSFEAPPLEFKSKNVVVTPSIAISVIPIAASENFADYDADGKEIKCEDDADTGVENTGGGDDDSDDPIVYEEGDIF